MSHTQLLLPIFSNQNEVIAQPNSELPVLKSSKNAYTELAILKSPGQDLRSTNAPSPPGQELRSTTILSPELRSTSILSPPGKESNLASTPFQHSQWSTELIKQKHTSQPISNSTLYKPNPIKTDALKPIMPNSIKSIMPSPMGRVTEPCSGYTDMTLSFLANTKKVSKKPLKPVNDDNNSITTNPVQPKSESYTDITLSFLANPKKVSKKPLKPVNDDGELESPQSLDNHKKSSQSLDSYDKSPQLSDGLKSLNRWSRSISSNNDNHKSILTPASKSEIKTLSPSESKYTSDLLKVLNQSDKLNHDKNNGKNKSEDKEKNLKDVNTRMGPSKKSETNIMGKTSETNIMGKSPETNIMGKSLEINKFNPATELLLPFKISIMGCRNSEKIKLIKNLLYHVRDKFSAVILFSPTERMNRKFKGIIPSVFVFDNLEDNLQVIERLTNKNYSDIMESSKCNIELKEYKDFGKFNNDRFNNDKFNGDKFNNDRFNNDKFNGEDKEIKDKEIKDKEDKLKHTLIIFENCGYAHSSWNSTIIKKLWEVSESINISILCANGYIQDLPSHIKTSFDYNFILGRNGIESTKSLYKYLDLKSIIKLSEFNHIFQYLGASWKCIARNNSFNIQDMLKYYNIEINLPPFKMCERSDVWSSDNNICDNINSKSTDTCDGNKCKDNVCDNYKFNDEFNSYDLIEKPMY